MPGRALVPPGSLRPIHCLLEILLAGDTVFWKDCLLETALWRDCALERLCFGNTMFWRHCALEAPCFGDTVFWQELSAGGALARHAARAPGPTAAGSGCFALRDGGREGCRDERQRSSRLTAVSVQVDNPSLALAAPGRVSSPCCDASPRCGAPLQTQPLWTQRLCCRAAVPHQPPETTSSARSCCPAERSPLSMPHHEDSPGSSSALVAPSSASSLGR